jgi:glucose/arabinose dehydrogenase/mono/diheme cytochrome c family protein
VSLLVRTVFAALVLFVVTALDRPLKGQTVTENGGVIVLEAENFNSNLSPRSSHQWEVRNTTAGFSGTGYMEATPNNGANIAADSNSPELQYPVNFATAGTRYVWIRGYGISGSDDSIHVGTEGGANMPVTLTQTNTWQWSNARQPSPTATPATIAVAAGNQTVNLWMREDGTRIDRVILTTNAAFAAQVGNTWHIPDSPEAPGGATMRSPVTVEPGMPVTIYDGHRFQNGGDMGNQLQTGSAVFYKRTIDANWSSVPMTFQAVIGDNKFYAGTIPAFSGGETVQYYIKVPFSDHLPTFIYGSTSQSQTTEIEAIAQAGAFTFNVLVAAHQGNTTLNLPADLPAAAGYTTENALGTLTFSQPIAIATPPGETNRLFVVERTGKIQVVTNLSTAPSAQVFLDLPAFLTATGGGTLSTVSEQGFLGLAFHPNYAQNGYFYIFYSVTINENGTDRTFERVARFTRSQNNANQADTSTFFPLISQLDEAGNHNGGDLHFGPDGYLYISVGDEGGANDQFDNARFINKDFFSAILRIDVDKKPGSLPPNAHSQGSTTFPSAVHAAAYTIPPDNPFIGATSHNGNTFNANTVRTEIFATGMRNPYRFCFDPPTGRMFVADVGQDAWEEIDLVTAGGDYGWSYFEATHDGPRIGTKPLGVAYASPIYEYGHGTGNFQGNSVTGGLVYRGSRLTELFEAYVFADYVSGRMWALRQTNGTWSASLLTTDANIVGFGIDPRNGDALFADIVDGRIARLARSGTTGTNPPALLSQTGAFSNLATLTPNAGILPYTPNVAFWSDYAVKTRWFSIPKASATIGFNQNGNWSFPTGAVWVKHFDFETRRGDPTSRRKLETRFIVKTATGSYGITYRWRSDQTDADLVAEDGLSETLNVEVNGSPTTQTWRYPSRSECRTCHTAVAGHVLSFNTRQLNRTNAGENVNQIKSINDLGYFSSPVSGINNFPAFATATDTSQSLEWRARSYFAVNCVQCHQPGGAALGNWDARPTTPTLSANMINGILADDRGDTANRFVKPNDTAHSMALKRIKGEGVPRMPPLATNELDPTAIQLLTDWITQDLSQRLSFAEWQIAHFGSTGNPDAAANADPDHDGQTNQQEFDGGTDPNNASSYSAPPALSFSNGSLQLNFMQPANRAALIETSTDLSNWNLWDVTGNSLNYPSAQQARSFAVPFDAAHRFFRLRISQP